MFPALSAFGSNQGEAEWQHVVHQSKEPQVARRVRSGCQVQKVKVPLVKLVLCFGIGVGVGAGDPCRRDTFDDRFHRGLQPGHIRSCKVCPLLVLRYLNDHDVSETRKHHSIFFPSESCSARVGDLENAERALK